MHVNEIAELLQPFLGSDPISAEQLVQVGSYLELLFKWNAKINLTAIRAPQEIVTRHFGESFFAARHLLARDASVSTAIDMGSGAGFPGLPLKIWSPGLSLTLIESNGRKATFLREVCRSLCLPDVEIIFGRAEAANSKADLVTLRAVERFESIVPVAESALKPRSTLGLLIGQAQAETAKKALPSLKWRESKAIPLSQNRVLLVGVRD